MKEWIYEANALESTICPAEVAMRLINNKWKIIILRDLLEKSASFGDLHRSVSGISRKILTENLREMERDYMIIREVIPGNVIRVQYKLSSLGESMKSIIRSLQDLGMEYIKDHPKEAVRLVKNVVKK